MLSLDRHPPKKGHNFAVALDSIASAKVEEESPDNAEHRTT